ncbi:hypothetical protein PR202_gb29959 [Eleusine coracana subsp. coracana]|uniref:LOB domain-containing protein n=1 Tax=Eleusine coracana subsp. coracana TaxID=191504 RepID=A0AAV5G0J9_ELECO|nr:hypothetical protein QOZ80_1BG0068530 [Eleusine coracana subsp. coracana]GJN40698.1 hypothetical protein PR202_gb29959 [Eleusine coracana subsp. coracana]
MRMSCNGCRVLRKGCSDACTIRPCLQWIKTPEAQANATVFLAKFYGRAGLLNLLAAPVPDLRPAVFRSLLYEACGRIVNPVYGSVGLLWSGQWQACQAAVEAVLKGEPVVRVADPEAAATPPLGIKTACDIRHVANKDRDLLRVSRTNKFKRAASSSTTSNKPNKNKKLLSISSPRQQEQELEPVVVAPSHHDDHEEESDGSHHQQQEGSSEAGSHVSQAEAEEHHSHVQQEEDEVGLDLTLGLGLVTQPICDLTGLSAASSLMGLRLELPA